jgi:hypothetical protein
MPFLFVGFFASFFWPLIIAVLLGDYIEEKISRKPS